MEAFSDKQSMMKIICFSWLSGIDTQRHSRAHSFTHRYIAFPLLRPYQLTGILFVTFGSVFPLVQNIHTNISNRKKTLLTSYINS